MAAIPLGGLTVGKVGQADDVALQIIACMTNPFMTGSLVVLDGAAPSDGNFLASVRLDHLPQGGPARAGSC